MTDIMMGQRRVDEGGVDGTRSTFRADQRAGVEVGVGNEGKHAKAWVQVEVQSMYSSLQVYGGYRG